jgi:hypothetical protein
MRKLLLKCECGEKMQVPRSAIGKSGMCPSCGRSVAIRQDNTSPLAFGDLSAPSKNGMPGGNGASIPSAEDKRSFGAAVDLYFEGRYGEALSLLNTLLDKYPDNAEIETARDLCVDQFEARMRRTPGNNADKYEGRPLTEQLVKDFVVDMMVNGSSEAAQLSAAELACRILGILPDDPRLRLPLDGDGGTRALLPEHPPRDGDDAAR